MAGTSADAPADASPAKAQRAFPTSRTIALGACVGLCIVLLIGLGIWQLARLGQKLALIDRVDHRIHAEPVAPPAPKAWPSVTAADDDYRRVRMSGRFLNDKETLTQAVTDYGPGFWVVTPLETTAGYTVLVNRGFVAADKRDPATRLDGQPIGDVTVTGLLRMTEPRGGFLRSNDPSANRWYSRDVAAIAAARGLANVAPYFIDADATPNPGGLPIGGLTVIRFANNHLVYALTWFGLGIGLVAGVMVVNRKRFRITGSH